MTLHPWLRRSSIAINTSQESRLAVTLILSYKDLILYGLLRPFHREWSNKLAAISWLRLIFTATSATNDNQPYISFTDKITSFFFLISVLAKLKMFICARPSLPQRKKYFTCKSRRSVLHHTAVADYWGIAHEDHKGKRGYLYQASGNR